MPMLKVVQHEIQREREHVKNNNSFPTNVNKYPPRINIIYITILDALLPIDVNSLPLGQIRPHHGVQFAAGPAGLYPLLQRLLIIRVQSDLDERGAHHGGRSSASVRAMDEYVRLALDGTRLPQPDPFLARVDAEGRRLLQLVRRTRHPVPGR